MTIGPGKYDDLCTRIREDAKAAGAIVIIVRGEKGSGFSVQSDLATLAVLPELLETMAAQMRKDRGEVTEQ